MTCFTIYLQEHFQTSVIKHRPQLLSSSEHPVQLDVIMWGDTFTSNCIAHYDRDHDDTEIVLSRVGRRCCVSGYTHSGSDWHSEGVGTQGGVSSRERRRRDSQLEPNPETRQQTHTLTVKDGRGDGKRVYFSTPGIWFLWTTEATSAPFSSQTEVEKLTSRSLLFKYHPARPTDPPSTPPLHRRLATEMHTETRNKKVSPFFLRF